MGLDYRDGHYRRYVVFGKRTVKDGEAMVVWNRSGVARQVTGPKLEYLYCSSIRFLNQYIAGPEEYLVVTKVDGRVEHVPGPTSLYENPTIHRSVVVRSAILLNSSAECVVIYRQLPPALIKTEEGYVASAIGGQQIDRLFMQGPTVIFPGVGDTVQNFTWSGPLVGSERLNFQVLNTAMRQVKVKGSVAFRGENKIKGHASLLLSMEIVDVAKMVDKSKNVMADLYSALELDLNRISLLAIETIQEACDLEVFGLLDSFPQLTSRAHELGVNVDSVQYSGFTPDENLRHHIQDLANVHAKYAKECIVREQNQQQMSMELSAKKDRLAHEESFMKAEIEMKQHYLEAEHKLKQSQLEYNLSLQQKQEDFDLEVLRKKNEESIRTLQTLSEMGVDLTKLLCTRPRFGLAIPALSQDTGDDQHLASDLPSIKQSNSPRKESK